jgi:hypothetical protein
MAVGLLLVPADGAFRWVRWIMAAFVMLIAGVFATMLRKTYGRENWLMSLDRRSGIWIKFRSYANEHFSDDDEVILQLKPEEIAWAGLTKERWLRPDIGDSGNTTQLSTYLDIGLKTTDTQELSRRLSEERNRRAPGKIIQTKYQDYPVRLIENSTLRLVLRNQSDRIIPAPQQILDAVSSFTGVKIRGMENKTLNTATPAKDSAAMDSQIRELIERGETIEAVKLTRKLYGCSLAEAKQKVEGLSAPPQNRKSA